MIKTKILVTALWLFAMFSISAEAKLYKWQDDQGVTHYGEIVPPEYADKNRIQIEKGHEVRKIEGSKAIAETPEEIEKHRRDQALLGTFSNEAEIDQARDRNLQQVNARMSSTQLRLKAAQDDVDGYQKEKDAMTSAGKPVDKILQGQLDQAAAKHAKLQDELTKSQAEAAAIKARYDADKIRFRELNGGGRN